MHTRRTVSLRLGILSANSRIFTESFFSFLAQFLTVLIRTIIIGHSHWIWPANFALKKTTLLWSREWSKRGALRNDRAALDSSGRPVQSAPCVARVRVPECRRDCRRLSGVRRKATGPQRFLTSSKQLVSWLRDRLGNIRCQCASAARMEHT